MTTAAWKVDWNSYQINFEARGGVPANGTVRITLKVVLGQAVVAEGWFKLRREGFWDAKLSRAFDQIIISNIEIDGKHRRIGLGTEIIRGIAGRFPEALIVGENSNDDAKKWHANHLDAVFPSRMMQVRQGVEVRVSPGVEVDQSEV